MEAYHKISPAALAEQLKNVKFNTFNIKMHIGVMQNVVEVGPIWSNDLISAGAFLKGASNTHLEFLIKHIQMNLELINREYPHITQYGIYIYQLSSEMIRFAKVTA